jgi:hypothetical protein
VAAEQTEMSSDVLICEDRLFARLWQHSVHSWMKIVCDVSLWHEVDFTTFGLASSDTFPSKTFDLPGSVIHIMLNDVYWEGKEAYKGWAKSSEAALTYQLSILWSTTRWRLRRRAKCMRGWLFQSGQVSDLP